MLYVLIAVSIPLVIWGISGLIKSLQYHFTYRLPIDHKDLP